MWNRQGRLLWGLAFAVMLWAVAGCTADTGVKTGSYVANLSLAESANVSITMPEARGFIDLLNTNGINVLEARLEYLGDIRLDVGGESVREITLAEDRLGRVVEGDTPIWEMRITNRVPVALTVNNGGELDANLSRLNLSTLTLNQSAGASNIVLPQGTFTVNVESASGDVNLVAGRGRVFNANVSVSGGALTFNVPAGAPVQVNLVAGDTASLTVAELLTQNGSTWQTEAFTGEDVQGMVINVTVSGGSVVINAVE